jgi:hypothetical protein
MRRYLTRISPNHAEGNGTTAGTGLRNWWVNVGRHLDERSSLVFWLSGLCKSKQYPLSGSATVASDTTNTLALAPYNGAFTFLEAPGTDFERDVMYEFNGAQLEIVSEGGARVAIYNQPNGKDTGDSAYRYRDHKSYGFNPDLTTELRVGAYHDGFDTSVTPNVPINFYNPDSFQIVAPGLDGASVAARITDFVDVTTNIQAVDEGQLDNITNFTQGRLDIEVE